MPTSRPGPLATDLDESRRLFDAHIESVPERVARFSMLLIDKGFGFDEHDWSSLDAFDDLWWWAEDNVEMFSQPALRLQDDGIDLWHPHLGDAPPPPIGLDWNGQAEMRVEAHEFASGLAALFTQFAIDRWGAHWVFAGDLYGDGSNAAARSPWVPLLEVARPFEHPSARFGPVRFSPEHEMAAAVRSFHADPLWNRWPVWHRLHDRVRMPRSGWGEVVHDLAERFHTDYVGGHLRRLSSFREWLSARGLDTTSLAFDSTTDLDKLWAWACKHLDFSEQSSRPRSEYRTWMPELAIGAEAPDRLPRWNDLNLSAETLTFASGLAACATEVALRSWGAEWVLGARRGDAAAAKRTHLRVVTTRGRTVWINPEVEVATWLADAIIVSKRKPPSRAMWRRVIGESDMIAQFTTMFETAPAPWVAWRAQFDPTLLPGLGVALGSGGAFSAHVSGAAASASPTPGWGPDETTSPVEDGAELATRPTTRAVPMVFDDEAEPTRDDTEDPVATAPGPRTDDADPGDAAGVALDAPSSVETDTAAPPESTETHDTPELPESTPAPASAAPLIVPPMVWQTDLSAATDEPAAAAASEARDSIDARFPAGEAARQTSADVAGQLADAMGARAQNAPDDEPISPMTSIAELVHEEAPTTTA